jgi:hypothetical protein
MNKEHFWPVWLIKRTGTVKDGVAWAGKKSIPALAATLPICRDCNSTFGEELEGPMAQLFDEIEAGKGLSDDEAELFVRWLWKLEGLYWVFTHPGHRYTQKYTLRQRALLPIDDIRGNLTLAVALAEQRDPKFEEGAMGIDSMNLHNAVFVSGVFSRIAVLVTLSVFDDEVPDVFSKYHFHRKRDPVQRGVKMFFPKVGFPTCTHAIGLLLTISPHISQLHDQLGEDARRRMNMEQPT